MNRPTCATCPFYDAEYEQCRNAPLPSYAHQDDCHVHATPDHWCGEHPLFPEYMDWFATNNSEYAAKQAYSGLHWREPNETPLVGEDEEFYALALVSLHNLEPFIISATYEGGSYGTSPGWQGLGKDMKMLAWMPEPEFKWINGEPITKPEA
jgi:hypothetical protein